MEIIKELWNDGSLWVLIAFVAWVYETDISPVLKSRLRNNHEQSLLAAADRAVASVAKVADATPADREQEMLSEVITYANKRNIPINEELAKSSLDVALTRFKSNGNQVKQSLKVHVNKDGSIEEDDNK